MKGVCAVRERLSRPRLLLPAVLPGGGPEGVHCSPPPAPARDPGCPTSSPFFFPEKWGKEMQGQEVGEWVQGVCRPCGMLG